MKRCLYIWMVFLWAGQACNHKYEQASSRAHVVNDSTVRSRLHVYVDSLWNQKDTTMLKYISADGYVKIQNGINVAKSPREMQSHLSVLFTAFPDLTLRLEKEHINDGQAFVLWSATGTNTGIYGEMAPTGKKMKITGMSQLYFNEEGKLYAENVYFNELELLQQLGYTLVPPVLH